MSRIDQLVEAARDRLIRVTPAEAAAMVERGALLVDTRPIGLRLADGEIPGALIVDRNQLEWRLDPSCEYRHAAVGAEDFERPVILFCDEGWASSLAAVSLQDIGLANATDLVGGFQAWVAAGLAVTGSRSRSAPFATVS
jgi:rhodanese-related sulfurtransferase